MKREAAGRAIQRWLYNQGKAIFLKANPWCQACHERRATEVHHKAGREGWLLCWIKHWMAVCAGCHRWITSHGHEAAARGWKTEVPPTTPMQRVEIASEIRAYITEKG